MLWDLDVTIEQKRKWISERGKEPLEAMHQKWFAQYTRKRPWNPDEQYSVPPMMMNYMYGAPHMNPMMMHPFSVRSSLHAVVNERSYWD